MTDENEMPDELNFLTDKQWTKAVSAGWEAVGVGANLKAGFIAFYKAVRADLVSKPEATTDQQISDFWADLASKQKPIPSDFAQVLEDNRWDLYDHAEPKAIDESVKAALDDLNLIDGLYAQNPDQTLFVGGDYFWKHKNTIRAALAQK